MDYPIVQIKTSDNLSLYGLFLHSLGDRVVFVNIHGTASNFYEEYYIEVFAKSFIKEGVSLLSTNNRGAGVYDAYEGSGAATEKFEDCIIDIDAWVEFVIEKGYECIVLSGHSLGTEKVVYYMNHGKYADRISAIILLSPSDSFGSHRVLDGKDNTKIRRGIEKLLYESAELVKNGRGDVFLPRNTYGSRLGIMPKTPESLINFLGSGSKLLEALPLETNRLEAYGRIKVPILVVIGDKKEYTALPIKDALALMSKENKNTKTVQIENCDHDFQGCEDKLSGIIMKFILSIKSLP